MAATTTSFKPRPQGKKESAREESKAIDRADVTMQFNIVERSRWSVDEYEGLWGAVMGIKDIQNGLYVCAIEGGSDRKDWVRFTRFDVVLRD